MPSPLTPFHRQQYLNLETYRKNGTAVQTPVWFVEDNGVLFVTTSANSGKVKRARRAPGVRIVPCDMRGAPRGEWLPATTEVIDDPTIMGQVNHLLNRKYGILKWLFERFSPSSGAMIVIKLSL